MSTTRAGERLAIVREWLKLSRGEFHTETGIAATRLFDLERLRQKVHDSDIQSVCDKYPEITDFLAHEGPARVGSTDLLLLRTAASTLKIQLVEIDSVRTRIFGKLWVRREEESFAPGYSGKIDRVDYYTESSAETGTMSFAVAVLRDANTYCESGLLILSADGELELEGIEGRKIASLGAVTTQRIQARPGTKSKVEKLFEIWESDIITA